jgi:succinate dehydrogenase/fumarate reductase flavoprotein subunit
VTNTRETGHDRDFSMTTRLTTDYLIVGSGAVGMAFADLLVAETGADIVMVDRFAKPGGHTRSVPRRV